MIEFFINLTPKFIHIIEIMGVLVVLYGSCCGFYFYIKEIIFKKNFEAKYRLARALAMGLEFKLAAEILKTVTVQSYDEIKMLAAIFALRIIMTFIIHFELKGLHKKKSEQE